MQGTCKLKTYDQFNISYVVELAAEKMCDHTRVLKMGDQHRKRGEQVAPPSFMPPPTSTPVLKRKALLYKNDYFCR